VAEQILKPGLPGEWPEKRKQKARAGTSGIYFVNLFKAMFEQLGEDTYPIIEETMRRNANTESLLGLVMRVMFEKLGEGAYPIIEEMMARNAERFFLPGLKGFGIEGKDPLAIATYFYLADCEVLGQPGEVFVEEGGRRAGFRLYKPCALFPTDKDLEETPPEVCHAFSNFERTAAKLAGQEWGIKMKTYFTKLLTKGDDYCEEVFEIEE